MTANINFPPQYLFYREARRNAPRTGCVHSAGASRSLSTMASDSNAHARRGQPCWDTMSPVIIRHNAMHQYKCCAVAAMDDE
eukprot:scaffold2874_cov30-Attheya_sp.AAC.3